MYAISKWNLLKIKFLFFFQNVDVFLILLGGASLKQLGSINLTWLPVVAKLPRSLLAVVHEGGINYKLKGNVMQVTPTGGVKLILMKSCWVQQFVPLLLFPIANLSVFNIVFYSLNMWNL